MDLGNAKLNATLEKQISWFTCLAFLVDVFSMFSIFSRIKPGEIHQLCYKKCHYHLTFSYKLEGYCYPGA